MAFNVSTAGLLTTGTTGPDYFLVASGALAATTIQGLAGNDTVSIADGASTATNASIDLAGGADTIAFSGGSYTASTILAGAGADTLTIASSTTFNNTTIDGGAGNDSIVFSGVGVFASSRLVLGGGVDNLTIISGDVRRSFIGAGAGADVMNINGSGQMTQLEVVGGGGADSITVSGHISGAGFLLNGDSSANGGGADTLTFTKALSGSTVKGKGGADVINVSGLAGTGAEVLGNAGADVITVSAAFASTNASGNMIGGGSGNDTIYLNGTTLGSTNTIFGGGGADSITLSAATVISGMIYGGAGADSITLSGAHNAFSGGSIAYASLSESTLSKMDVITFGSGAMVDGLQSAHGATGDIAFSMSAVTKSLRTGLAAGVGFSGVVSDGFIHSGHFSDQGVTAGGVTARAALLDGQSSTLGETYVFEDINDKAYIFVQGGASGTADDLIINVGTGVSLSAAAPTMSLASGKISFT